jgi:hypothetical protein
MDFKSWPLTFGALAAVLAVVLAQGAPPAVPEGEVVPAAPVAGPPSAAPPAEPGPCRRWCEPLRLYEEFFALPSGERSLDRIAATATGLGYAVETVVALIPDPLDSGMSYRSDEALEAIQRGFADTGHLFDRQWFPWDGKAAEARLYRKEPGALLFRRSSDPRGPVVTLVLLVGETPKSGVHKAALREALDLAGEVQRATGGRGPLRILGPTFSGSIESLRVSLDRWLAERGPLPASDPPSETTPAGPAVPGLPAGPRVHIISGSATAPGLEEGFERLFGGTVRFERTVLPDDLLTCEAFSYLHDSLGWDFEHAALLTEFDTSYGKGAREGERSTGRPGTVTARPDSCESRPRPAFSMEFPSHLSRIRTAREKEGLRQTGAEPDEVVGSARRTLDPGRAGRDEEPVDVVPQLDPMSTASDDLVLAHQLQALCREGIRYVGILATDIEDRLFLAEHVRSYCPDVVLFTFDNHLLEGHPRYTRAMEGSLILTSFPLSVGSNDEGYLRQTKSELEHGILLAVRQLLLGRAEKQPRPWLVAVGKGGLWPLARLDEQRAAPRFTIAGTESVAFKWITASVVIALLAGWLWISARPFHAIGERGWTASGGGPGVRLLLLLGMGALTLASGVLLVFYSLPLWNRELLRNKESILSERGLLWGANLIVLAAVYIVMILACERLLRPAFRLRPAWRVLLWLAGSLLLFALLREAALGLWILPEGAELFYARAGDFGSGLSPLVSLGCLLAAVYTWALLELRRRRLVLIQEISWPLSASAAASEQPLATCGRRARQLDRFLWAWLPGLWFWLALAFALILPARRLLRGIQPIAEPAAYGWVFLAVVALAFTLGATAFHRFVMTWRKLEETLDLLCHTWMLTALQKNAAAFDWKPLRSFGWRMPRHKMSLASVQELKVLAHLNLLGPDGAALTGPDGTLDRTLGGVFEAERQGDVASEFQLRKQLQSRFAASAHTAEAARRQLGGLEPRIADAEGKLKPGPNEIQVREIEKYLALRVAAWLRYVFAHLRYALLTALLCGLFVLTGVSTYAFQPKRYLSFGIWAALLLGSLLVLRTFIRMDRNAVLSAAAGTDPGKVSFDRTFFTNLFTYVGVPVLGVVLTQFPAVGSLLGEWFQPLLRLLTGS